MFSLSDIPDATVCSRRAENNVGTLRWTLARGPKEKGQEKGRKESSGRLLGRSLASSGDLLGKCLGLLAAVAGVQVVFQVRGKTYSYLEGNLFHCSSTAGPD